MLLRPELPPAPNLPATTTHAHEPVCSCQHTPSAPRRSLSSVSTGAVGLVLVSGVVLTALVTAVAVSAISVAVAAVVLRSLLNSQQHRNR
ncbi:SpdD protein [Streptomyces oryzae]|uniref:SpdD protein n=1 Tax=Streptomyces oryzae TaxID=1434886 RepID=A0ABS3XG75_9ACTN|nr:SpdD protein [Streptomyces oryzae]MBO8194348.1 SpdD protein [Streptomyces oryzae]